MSEWNIAAKSQEERDKVNVDLAASGVAYKERLNMPVIAEAVMREQSPKASDPRYVAMAEANKK
jgi:DNA polymerase III, theta subunit.